MRRLRQAWALAVGAVLMASCATLDPDYEEPTVTLASFEAGESGGMSPSFDIGLRILNPNKSDLELAGIVYTISLQGRDVIKGVGKDFPVIEAYSEEVVHITASASLLEGLKLITDMTRDQGSLDQLEYTFEAKLDLVGPWPSIRVSESGVLGGAREN